MFRQNIFHTGYTNFTGPLAPDLAWQYNTVGFTYSSPIVTTDRVYIASEDELIALDLDGDELWAFTFSNVQNPPAVDITGLISTPAIAPDGTIYIGSLDNNLYAINPTGTLKWTLDTGDQIFSSPTIGPDGTIYIGSRSGQLFAVNPDGTIRWVAATEGEILSSPAVGPDGVVYVGATDNRLYALNGISGAFAWPPFTTEGEIVSSPAIGNGNVYFGSLDSRLYAVDTDTGVAAWNAPFQTGAEIVSSPAVGPDGSVYIGSFDGRFYAVNGNTGAAKWQNPLITGSLIAASPAIDGFNNIYITSLDGSLYVISDATTRFDRLWSFPTGSPIWASPAIGPNSSVFIAATGSQSEAGRLFAINQAAYNVTFATQLLEGQDAPFSVSVTGAPVSANGTLFYRAAGTETYASLLFSGNAIIPGTAITGTGFEYYITGPQGTFPDQTPENNPASKPVFINSDTAPDHFLPRIHRMISVPYDLTGKTVADVLIDDYQEYGPQSWRLHRWNGNAYEEYPNLSENFEPGQAFFLVTTGGEPFNVDSGWSVDTSQPYPIDLQPGWNQIGNPFGFPVPWNRVVRNPQIVNTIAFFDGAQMIQNPDDVAVLMPWEGYFVYNSSDQMVTILISPEPASIPEEELIEEEAGKVAGKTASKSAQIATQIQISASIEALGLEDSQNWVGLHNAPSNELDLYNIQEAPPFGEHIRLSIMEEGQRYAMRTKPANSAGASWDLVLTTSDPSIVSNNVSVSLDFSRESALGESALNEALQMVLIDEDYGYARDISNNTLDVDWGDNLPARHFKLVLGTAQHIDNVLTDITRAPATSTLDQNFPNPFQRNTRIGYQLSDRSDVTLTIYNVLGQEVQRLIQSTQNPGQYEAVWDGQDKSGQAVSSGIYIYRLQAGAFSSSGKMTLLR
ncbi:MAG: PQQ-binding-like beta-propeller repeat protein [Rhodothermales bacterium]